MPHSKTKNITPIKQSSSYISRNGVKGIGSGKASSFTNTNKALASVQYSSVIMTAAKQSISPDKASEKLKALPNEFESQIKTFLTGIREQSEERKQTY